MKLRSRARTRDKKVKRNRGMTYVELIVVLGIFGVMLSIALFNYKKFQGKVDIKNLANDVALRLVEAQKSSVSGKWNTLAASTWKPSYGVYFSTSINASNKFIYFADLNNSNSCSSAANCTPPNYTVGGEVLEIINITKGNTISSLQIYRTGCASPFAITSLSTVFRRPSSIPTITTTPASGCGTISYYAINITSPASTQSVTSQIKLYPSGRIQIN